MIFKHQFVGTKGTVIGVDDTGSIMVSLGQW